MAIKHTSKKLTSTVQRDTAEQDKPGRKNERQRRRRSLRAQSEAVAVHSNPALVATAARSEPRAGDAAAPATRDEPAAKASTDAAPNSADTRGGTFNGSTAGQRPASTKRAMMIGMLERPEGASVAEIGERLGWLPHTVRAAITGLRHAGREVTRSKDGKGQTVYRLAPVETAEQ
jgi:hypothetical protein